MSRGESVSSSGSDSVAVGCGSSKATALIEARISVDVLDAWEVLCDVAVWLRIVLLPCCSLGCTKTLSAVRADSLDVWKEVVVS